MCVSKMAVLSVLVLAAGCGRPSSDTGEAGGGGAGGDGASATSEGGGGGGATTSTTGTTSGSGATTSTTTTASSSETTTATSSDSGSASVGPGCENAGATPVSFANDIQPIFSQSCGNTCHLGSSPSEGLSLKPGQAHASLVGVDAAQDCNGQKRVSPGSAAGSYLVNKIMATDHCPQTKKMPPQTSLSAARRQLIVDWICQGALNN